MLQNTVLLANSYASLCPFPATEHLSVYLFGNHDQSLDWKGSESTDNLMCIKMKICSSNNDML